jgi:hypothetical protein
MNTADNADRASYNNRPSYKFLCKDASAP